ncbi:hypothetical protein KDN34_12865 [Shewanella yunxiaonensis]|uniref:Uncharacterized protein n=1 Tax=Shewanella yunxiaonensis TaxID=2829809 RepID=A0ABX7YR57_9GAMM|nr:hypothetical protein [Shewanella yunxiaonensis]QUN05099.1 hypothetical protein KDN34_12865 [Shewanella yunxiaonensis]
MSQYFDQLKSNLEELKLLSAKDGAIGFFSQEALRFHSVAGTILSSFKADTSASVDERYITHILSRSLMENYFWLLYIFDDAAKRDSRYQELINSFKRDYNKLLNEPLLPHKDKLEPSQTAWASAPKAMDVNSMLAQLTNNYGDRLSYLYFIYRVTSFDTHGKNLNNILQTAFGKTANFPILDIGKAFELVANQYLVTLAALKAANEI